MKPSITKPILYVLLACLVSFAAMANTLKYSDLEVNRILKLDEPPAGVVFEVLDWEDDTWTWAAPKIRALTNQLKAKFPDIDVVIVSHGEDQFQLTQDAAEEQPEAIAELQSLTESGVNLHVCGTHSSWRDVAEDAYLDFVDVSPSGPAQINDYIKFGYKQVLLQGAD